MIKFLMFHSSQTGPIAEGQIACIPRVGEQVTLQGGPAYTVTQVVWNIRTKDLAAWIHVK